MTVIVSERTAAALTILEAVLIERGVYAYPDHERWRIAKECDLAALAGLGDASAQSEAQERTYCAPLWWSPRRRWTWLDITTGKVVDFEVSVTMREMFMRLTFDVHTGLTRCL